MIIYDSERWPVPYVRPGCPVRLIDDMRTCPFCIVPVAQVGKQPAPGRRDHFEYLFFCRACAGYFTVHDDSDRLVAVEYGGRPQEESPATRRAQIKEVL